MTFSITGSTTEESPQHYRELRKQFHVVPAGVLFTSARKRAGKGRRKVKYVSALCFMAFVLELVCIEHALAISYAVTDLGILPGYGGSVAQGISDSGYVVGYSFNVLGEDDRAFIWKDGEIQDLGSLAGLSQSDARGVNDAGTVVGFSMNDIGLSDSRAVVWDTGGIRELGILPGGHLM